MSLLSLSDCSLEEQGSEGSEEEENSEEEEDEDEEDEDSDSDEDDVIQQGTDLYTTHLISQNSQISILAH